MENNRIRCNSCEHICTEEQLLIVEGIEHCPHCGSSGFLMDLDVPV